MDTPAAAASASGHVVRRVIVRFRDATASDVLRGVKPVRLAVAGVGRLRLDDGREAWAAGPDWLVGDPADLARLFSAV